MNLHLALDAHFHPDHSGGATIEAYAAAEPTYDPAQRLVVAMVHIDWSGGEHRITIDNCASLPHTQLAAITLAASDMLDSHYDETRHAYTEKTITV